HPCLHSFPTRRSSDLAASAQSSHDLRSPDGRIEVRIRTAKEIRYDVLLRGRSLLQDCTLSLDVDHKLLGPDAKVLKSKERSSKRSEEHTSELQSLTNL